MWYYWQFCTGQQNTFFCKKLWVSRNVKIDRWCLCLCILGWSICFKFFCPIFYSLFWRCIFKFSKYMSKLLIKSFQLVDKFFHITAIFYLKITFTSNQEVCLKELGSEPKRDQIFSALHTFLYSLWSFKLAHTAQKQKPLVAHSSLFFLFPEAIKIWNSIFSSFSFTPKTMCIMWCGRVTCRLGLKSRLHFHKTWEQFLIFLQNGKPLSNVMEMFCPLFLMNASFCLYCWIRTMIPI